jgi:deoxyribose-phosphate aldolase
MKGRFIMNIAKMIDHTLLKPETIKSQIIKLTEEAKKHNFASVCVNPTWVKLASEKLHGSEVKASGGIHTKQEALDMIEAGATRIGASAGITIVSE